MKESNSITRIGGRASGPTRNPPPTITDDEEDDDDPTDEDMTDDEEGDCGDEVEVEELELETEEELSIPSPLPPLDDVTGSEDDDDDDDNDDDDNDDADNDDADLAAEAAVEACLAAVREAFLAAVREACLAAAATENEVQEGVEGTKEELELEPALYGFPLNAPNAGTGIVGALNPKQKPKPF